MMTAMQCSSWFDDVHPKIMEKNLTPIPAKNWERILKNKCPKCNKPLDFQSDKGMMMCTISCGFMISTPEMEKLCIKIYSKKNNIH